jgi:FixJ family two-component response regulator
MALMTRGKPNKVMAAELGLSQRTVEIHRAHVMEKSGASSIAQLVRMALDSEKTGGPES